LVLIPTPLSDVLDFIGFELWAKRY
jgi:hypothetical protein